jgi:hypothetical protein
MQDVSGLALILKELIPDYNPTSRLLSEALKLASDRSGNTAWPDTTRYGERTVETRLSSSVLMN